MQNSTNITLTYNSNSYIAYLNQISKSINDGMVIGIAVIGVPGNLISMLVFARLIHKKTNMGLLYTCQCAIDLFSVLLLLFFTRGTNLLFGISIATLNDPSCRFFMFFRRYGWHISSWMAVITAFDRYMFVFYEHRFKFMRKKRNLFAICMTMLVAMALINVPSLFFSLVPKKGCTADFGILFLSDIMSMAFRTYIPLAFMIFFNTKLVLNTTRKSASIHQRQNSKRSHTQNNRHLTIAVVSFSVIFFITHFPISVFFIIYDIKLYSAVFQTDQMTAALYNLPMNVIINFSLLDQVLSIFTYLAFNKLFRREFFKMLNVVVPFKSISSENKTTIEMSASVGSIIASKKK